MAILAQDPALAKAAIVASGVYSPVPTGSALTTLANHLVSVTKFAAIPAGNGFTFTVSDPDAGHALALANGYALSFPPYLFKNSSNPKLASDLAAQHKIQTKLKNAAALGLTADDIAKYRANLVNVNADIAYLANPADFQQATSTQTRTATGATQTQPQTSRTILIGAFIGFVFGILLAFLQDLLDTRVRSADETGRRLRLPLLAQIPSPPRQAGGELVMQVDAGPAIVPSTEAYRIAKLNFTAALTATQARIVMFTSAGMNDGTSETVANLALVLARSGKHVVLVDANLREPAQADNFGLQTSLGLADVLAGSAKLADVLTGVDVRRVGPMGGSVNGHAPVDGILEVVPAGRAPFDPAELLDTRAAGELLRALSGRADVVLVDAPAILPVTDAMVLAPKVDAVVVVTRAGRDSRQSVVALRRALDNCPAPGLAFVFTGAAADGRNEYGGSYKVPARGAEPTAGWSDEERDPREIGVL
jgi:capsular exopolysaccharide synthesis family protein